ncbi:hypothetical protein PFDG_04276 [Plasmodium falciparum Dd2]|uniref:F-BAR domain-containing protein n=1 Tax=Plasmodium falciparum (isolate Dd2) TaxID=57267 RepID=A0A0L7M5I5_PLAF4|nr:hypothetical protein PFDG_04276 [Plasmodium falciparum Dd2]
MACSDKREDVGSLENIKKSDKNEENLRNFESTFIYDWKKALKRVEEGRNCCENLSRIFSEMIRIEKDYENNLRNLCNMFQIFDNESSGINNGIISLRKNIERRCEQIKDFINYMECEILNNTLNSTLINHKNVFDQIKVDGIENDRIVERTRKESLKNIENCVYAYENLIDCINIFHNSRYFHPLKRIELSTSCINKYLFAKKKEYEYKNTINNINSVELKKEKRLKSILYSLESMDHKRISCVKDNIMKYLIFFTSYIRNIQYDINSCIDVFKDINAYKEIEEYCISHSNINRKKENEDLIFYNNIVSWPMLIDYFNELYNINKKHLDQNITLNGEMQVDYTNHNKKGEKSESDIESDYSYKYIKNIYEKFENVNESNGDVNGCSIVSPNINNNVKRMKIFFRYYMKNLFLGNFDKILDFHITSHFNIYRNRFLFCECLIDFIKKKRVFFVNVKSIVIFAKIILILLDYCNLHLDYWSCIYILVASEKFFCELEVDDINTLLSKYPFNEKVKENSKNKKRKKKILNNNIIYNVNGKINKNININIMNEKNSLSKDIDMSDESKKNTQRKKDTFSSSSF